MIKEKQPNKHLAETVPEQLPPPRTDVPRPARTVRGLLALPGMVLLWIMPKRVGPSLTGSGWRAAIAAHLLALAFGTGMIAWAEWLPGQNAIAGLLHPDQGPSGLIGASEWLRAPLAAWALICREHCATPGGVLSFAVGVIAFEAALLLIAVSLMPFAGAGEKTGRLFGRCMRLTWWSTTTWLLLGLGWLLEGEFRKLIGLPADPGWLPVDYALLAAFATWWLFVLLRSANLYTGPPEGPAWQPRTPVCHGCGYNIACLSHSTNCPECGRGVEESLPLSLGLPAYATGQGTIARSKGFWATVFRVFFDKAFFERIAVWKGHIQARKCFLDIVLFNSIATAALTTAVVSWESPLYAGLPDAALHHIYGGMIVFTILLVAQILGLGLLISVMGLFCPNRFQPMATACFYASAALIPVPVLGVVWILIGVGYHSLRDYPRSEAVLGYLAVIAMAILPVVAFYPVIRGFVRAWRCARRANA